MVRLLILSVLLSVLVGCATYEFDVTRPAELATHIGRKEDAVVKREPLVYRLRAAEGRLVMNVVNRLDEPIQLLGEQSTVVDPEGQSHPLRSQAIAPNSYVKLILPPLRPVLHRSGPTFGIGVGTYVGDRRGYRDDPFYDDWHHEPQYFTVIDDDAIFWNWRGESEIRLTLAFQRKGETFTHEFIIRRIKV